MSVISLNPNDEKKYIEQAKKDKNDFSPLYAHHKKYILDFFTYRVRDREVAEDLTSKVFEKALNGIDNFQWQGVSFSSWPFKIARNTLIDYFRETGKTAKRVSDEAVENVVDKQNPPEQQYEIICSEDILYKILNDLPPRERDIIYMKFFDGYTNRLISKLTGLSETNIGTILYRAIKKIRLLYQEME